MYMHVHTCTLHVLYMYSTCTHMYSTCTDMYSTCTLHVHTHVCTCTHMNSTCTHMYSKMYSTCTQMYFTCTLHTTCTYVHTCETFQWRRSHQYTECRGHGYEPACRGRKLHHFSFRLLHPSNTLEPASHDSHMTQCSVGEGRGYLTVCLLWSVMMVGWAQLMYSCGRGGGGRDGVEGEGGGMEVRGREGRRGEGWR